MLIFAALDLLIFARIVAAILTVLDFQERVNIIVKVIAITVDDSFPPRNCSSLTILLLNSVSVSSKLQLLMLQVSMV